MRVRRSTGLGSLIVLVVCAAVGAAPPSPEFHPLAQPSLRVSAQFSAIEREIARLESLGLDGRAGTMRRELDYFAAQFAGMLPSRSEEPALDWISIYRGPLGNDPTGVPPTTGEVTVRVNPSDRPTVLVLSSSQPVSWKLEVAEGADLDRIILHSTALSSLVSHVPPGVEVEHAGWLPFAHGKEFDGFTAAARVLHQSTGLAPASFQSTYAAFDPFVVGRENLEWRAHRVMTEMRPLYLEATAFERARAREAVAEIRFPALVRNGEPRRPQSSTIATFSPFGPVSHSLSLDSSLDHFAIDQASGAYYGVSGSQAYAIDPADGALTPLPPVPATLPRVEFPSGIAFDRRGRLVLATYSGEGYLYGYSPDNGQWSVVRSLEGIDLQALTYSPAHDRFFGMGSGSGLVPEIFEFRPDGRLEGRVSIEQVLPPMPAPAYQLIAIDGLVGLITPAVADLDMPHLPPENMFLLIHPLTGEVRYRGTISIPEPVALLLPAAISFMSRRRVGRH